MRTKIPTLIPKMQEKSIKFETVGDLWLLPADIRTLLIDATQSTETGSTMTFVLAFAYSGQDEIVRAVKRCMQE
jgi:undecaprenyl diphosphate synthase